MRIFPMIEKEIPPIRAYKTIVKKTVIQCEGMNIAININNRAYFINFLTNGIFKINGKLFLSNGNRYLYFFIFL